MLVLIQKQFLLLGFSKMIYTIFLLGHQYRPSSCTKFRDSCTRLITILKDIQHYSNDFDGKVVVKNIYYAEVVDHMENQFLNYPSI